MEGFEEDVAATLFNDEHEIVFSVFNDLVERKPRDLCRNLFFFLCDRTEIQSQCLTLLERLLASHLNDVRSSILEVLSHRKNGDLSGIVSFLKLLVENEDWLESFRDPCLLVMKSMQGLDTLLEFATRQYTLFMPHVVLVATGPKHHLYACRFLRFLKESWENVKHMPPQSTSKVFKSLIELMCTINSTQEFETVAGELSQHFLASILKDDEFFTSDVVRLKSRFEEDFNELEVLGVGGYAEVIRCQHKLDKTFYAVKKIKFDGSEARKNVISREVCALSHLQHKHIVRYHQAWVEAFHWRDADSEGQSHCLYVQMELCQRTLEDLLDEGIGEDEAWSYFRQIVEGLSYVHKNLVIHRDLAPKNIFLDNSNNIKIGDFGLAILCEGEEGYRFSRKPRAVGNIYHMAPEVEHKNIFIDAKVDIFSLGVILFELLHWCKSTQKRRELLRDVKKRKFPVDWDRSYESFILELLSEDPRRRPTAMQILGRLDSLRGSKGNSGGGTDNSGESNQEEEDNAGGGTDYSEESNQEGEGNQPGVGDNVEGNKQEDEDGRETGGGLT